ncbi:1-acyl-sn-glycerol-3-phosphate acyltransferase [Altererythrobacter xixiisoli]|uniref:1-acyl-sn-glycerol-3-phosphate acyltransferase n=1 Tax=Croceibacterium xixiisoli TaxID=1476466 RepID=A0A6I4TUH1_9SPHN|nr:1-acyl-sn-glycerol-3-phosphate acyltransferase [Croceibacterium xixiisoli]MXO99716.1 1-acyl-sn-glycerol-3-phosphate acyltransferase [Croceibacterium xixiisoli]
MGTLRLALRGLCIILTFLALVPLHLLCSVAGHRHAIPPVFLGLIGRLAGLRITTRGRAEPGGLLIANHVSWLDILALGGAARTIFVAHSGLAGHGGLKWLCDQNDTVFITREKRGSVVAQVQQVRDALSERPLTIFPEGTTNNGVDMLPFRSALLAAVEPLAGELPIQPTALIYRHAGEISWFGAETGMANALRLLRRPGRIDLTIYFLPPLSGEALRDRKTMTAAAEQAIRDAIAG